jgi:hypothetical protein
MASNVMTQAERRCMHGVARDLHSEFRGIFGEETIESLVLDSYAELASTATVSRWLVVGAERFARQRLQALAHAESMAKRRVRPRGRRCHHDGVRQGWPLAGDGFAGGQPFHKAELEALALLYLQAFSQDLTQRAAQEVLSLEAHGDHLDEPLYEPGRPRAALDVVCQQQQPAGPQDAVHLADSPAFIRDCA